MINRINNLLAFVYRDKMFEIAGGALFILLTVMASGYIFSRALPRKILLRENILYKLSFYLLIGWPFLFAINAAISFFYIGPFTIVSIFVVGIVLLAKDLPKQKETKIHFRFKINLLNMLVFTILIVAFSMLILLLEFMGWPPIGDVATGHGPRTALFLMNQKIPLSPEPYLILYPPGFSALSATFASTLGIYPALAVFELAGAATASIVLGIYLISELMIKNSFIALVPVAFVFVPSPDLNMTRWILGHLLNGTYPNLVAYLILSSLFLCLWLLHSKGDMSFRNIFLIIAIFGFGLLFTYPAFFMYFGILSITPIILNPKLRGRIISYLNKPPLRIKNVAMILIIIALSLAAFYRSYILDAFSLTYLANVIFGYLTGSYVLGGASIFSEYSSYTLPLSVILSDYRTAFLVASLVMGLYSIAKRKSGYEITIYVTLAIFFLASFLPAFSRVSWMFMSDRVMAFIQILAIATFCRYFLLLPEALQMPRFFFSNRKLLTKKLSSKLTISILLLLLMGSSVAFTSMYAYERAMVWGWSSHTPYFKDDFSVIEYASNVIPQMDLIMGDGSFAVQFIMSIAVKNISCFDFYRASQPELYFGGERYWDNPYDTDYLRIYVIKNNVSYVISMSEPMRITVNKQSNVLEYTPKPFDPGVYASILDSVPFLEKLYQSGNSGIYRVNIHLLESHNLSSP